MAVHKVRPSDAPKDPPRVRRFPARPGDDPSRQRVRELVDAGFLDRSAAEPHLGDPGVDRLPTKRTS